MKQLTAAHPLAALRTALRDAEMVLLPVDAAVADGTTWPEPTTAGADDVLRALCASPTARGWISRAAARWSVGREEPAEPREGFAVLPVPLSRSVTGGVRYAAVTLLAEALGGETIDQLAHSARMDARIARTLVGAGAPWDRRSMPRLARMVAALARSESERLAGAEAGARLGAAWEELHLLHSLSGEMTVGAAPMHFVTRTLGELRQTLGCRWTALRVGPAAAPLFASAAGAMAADGIIADGPDVPADRRRLGSMLASMPLPGRALVVGGGGGVGGGAGDGAGGDLVLAPVRRDGAELGLLAAGDRLEGDGAMSNWERTLVETAAGHLAVFLDNARLYRDLDAMFMGAMSALVSAIDAKDPYTRGHSQRVALLSRQIAEAAGLAGDDLKYIHIAGLVHDVGKIGMPESILRKQARLTDEEFAVVKQHPEIGWRILRDIPQFAPVLDGVRYHHERYDGRGYPHGLRGEGIPLFARIIAIADTFDAMSSTRTYRAAKPREAVLAEMQACAGTQHDARLFQCFRGIDLRGYDALNAAHAADMQSADAQSTDRREAA